MPESLLDAETLALDVSGWVNSAPISPESLRGRVVIVEAFQMLCPGCVSHGLPLAQRLHGMFDPSELVVLGLHTVFEHHAVMGREALEVFLSEYRIEFPVAIDRPVASHDIPATMQRYGLRGTPSMMIVDREGRVRQIAFGTVDEVALGVYLGRLLAEPVTTSAPVTAGVAAQAGESCGIDGVCT